MKLPGGVLFASITCYTAAAAATVGHVFVYDPVRDNTAPTAPKQAPSLSPDTARLILAQRLGVSQYHSIENVQDDDLISHLNAYGGSQELFADDHTPDRSYAHLLVWIEDVDDIGG
jgi:hypothetical protein